MRRSFVSQSVSLWRASAQNGMKRRDAPSDAETAGAREQDYFARLFLRIQPPYILLGFSMQGLCVVRGVVIGGRWGFPTILDVGSFRQLGRFGLVHPAPLRELLNLTVDGLPASGRVGSCRRGAQRMLHAAPESEGRPARIRRSQSSQALVIASEYLRLCSRASEPSINMARKLPAPRAAFLE